MAGSEVMCFRGTVEMSYTSQLAGFFAWKEVAAHDFHCIEAHGCLVSVAPAGPGQGASVFQNRFFAE